MKRRVPISVLLGVLLIAGCSGGGHHHQESEEAVKERAKTIIQAMDLNGDNEVSWEEASKYFDKMFDRLDVGHKGYITPEEFQAINNDPVFKAMPLEKLQISFTMFNRASDGKLTREDFQHMGDRIFSLLDRNMDGEISEEDFTQQDAGSHGDSGGKSGGRHGGGGSPGGW